MDGRFLLLRRWTCAQTTGSGVDRDEFHATKNPARWPGLFVVALDARAATAYPAECRTSGRRAREVMPAAMRALVSTVAV